MNVKRVTYNVFFFMHVVSISPAWRTLIAVTSCPWRKLKREHIGGVVRPKVAPELRGLRFGRHARSAHLSAAIGACEPRCSTFDMN